MVRSILHFSRKDPHCDYYRYLNGEHIACVGNQAGNGGGYCAFLQGTRGANGGKIKELAHNIPDHGFVLSTYIV